MKSEIFSLFIFHLFFIILCSYEKEFINFVPMDGVIDDGNHKSLPTYRN